MTGTRCGRFYPNTPRIRPEVVYCWIGGREEGSWIEVTTYSVEDTIAQLTRQGYVAVRGSESVGPPEGPPSDDRFKALGL